MAGEASTKGERLKEKDIKLQPTSIYKLGWNRLQKLKSHLKISKFEEIHLDWTPDESGFDVKLFAIAKDAKCNLVHVMKKYIRDDREYAKTHRKTFILIAENNDENLKSAFAICTGAGYRKIIPYVDAKFAFSVAKKILDPKSVGQWKCRYLTGRTIRLDELYQKDKRGTILPTVVSDNFFIAEGFQAQIAPVSDLTLLSRLRSSVKVTRLSLKIRKLLHLKKMLCLLKELLQVYLSKDYEEKEAFEFLDYVKPVTTRYLKKILDHRLEKDFFDGSKVYRNGFFICHTNYEEWVKCESVELLEKMDDGKKHTKTWKFRPDVSDIFDALHEEHTDCSALQMNYRSQGKLRHDRFLNYIQGHVLHQRKYYFHIGKDWFKVDVEYIRRMNKEFFKLVQEKLLSVTDCGYLPLPWCSEIFSNGPINAKQCINFCLNVLYKDLSTKDKTKIERIFLTSDRKSDHGQSPSLQGHEETSEYSSSESDGSDHEEKNLPPLPESLEAVGETEVTSLDDDDDDDGGDDDDDDDGGDDDDGDDDDNNDDTKSITKGKKPSTSPRQRRRTDESRKYEVSGHVKRKLAEIIGEVECKLCLESLTSRDEVKYNTSYYMLLNQFLQDNPKLVLNERLGVDPDNKFPTFLHGDRILAQNVELFDILKITKDTVYLYHVKEGFGQKTRDVVSQILSSANLIKNDGLNTLHKWYEQVMNYEKEGETRIKLRQDLELRKCSKEDFVELFQTKKIVYVYAFIDDTVKRKPFNELVSPEQCLLQKSDLYQALMARSPGKKRKVDVLCEYLKSKKIIADKDNRFVVRREFLNCKTRELFQIFKEKGFSQREADLIFHTLEKRFVPTVSIKSHIAKFELLRLNNDFANHYSDFELKFCQIRNPRE